MVADEPLRKAFNGLDRVFRNYNPSKKQAILEVLKTAEEDIKKAADILKGCLKGHMKEKNLAKIDAVINTIGKVTFFEPMFDKGCAESDSPIYQDLFILIHAMNQYTAFHYEV